MSEKWQVEPGSAQVIEVGSGRPVTGLKVALIGGHVDVVGGGAAGVATVEVHEVEGEPLTITWDGSTVVVKHGADAEGLLERVKQWKSGDRSRRRARISIRIPDSCGVSLATVSATVVVGALRHGAKLNTVSGDVTGDDLQGAVRLNTVSGSVEVHAVTGSLKANTVSGHVVLHDCSVDEARLHTVSGDILLDLTGPRVDVRSSSVSGDVTLRCPLDQGYDVVVNSAGGATIVDGRQGERGSKTARLHEGAGAVRVRANAVSGDVVLLRPEPATSDDADSDPALDDGREPA